MERDLEEAKEILGNLSGLIAKSIDPELRDQPSRVPFHITYLREILGHRIVDLSEKSIALIENNQLVPAFLVIRATMESVALLYNLHEKIIAAIESTDIDTLSTFLENAALGSRNDDTDFTAQNILTALDKLERKYNGVREMYDQLSEFCHPNFAGLMASYSRLDKDNIVIILGPDNEPPMPLGDTPFVVSLKIGEHYFQEIGKNLGAIKKLTGVEM